MNSRVIAAARAAGYPGVKQSIIWFVLIHVLAVTALLYLFWVQLSWITIAAAALFYICGQLAITAGAHRLYCHRAYKANGVLQAVFLVVLAGTMQKSTLWWASNHREHHAFSDTDHDPYSTKHGFWWAHIGWIVFASNEVALAKVKDLAANRLVMWQHRFYYPLAFVVSFGLPTIYAVLWSDPLGGFLVCGCLRLCLQYHLTFCINSLAHFCGHRQYTAAGTAYTNVWLAPLTAGESYHEAHHLAEEDYRIGRRWFDLDPGKWLIWMCSKLGLAWDLKRVTEKDMLLRVRRAEAAAAA